MYAYIPDHESLPLLRHPPPLIPRQARDKSRLTITKPPTHPGRWSPLAGSDTTQEPSSKLRRPAARGPRITSERHSRPQTRPRSRPGPAQPSLNLLSSIFASTNTSLATRPDSLPPPHTQTPHGHPCTHGPLDLPELLCCRPLQPSTSSLAFCHPSHTTTVYRHRIHVAIAPS